MLKVVRVKAIIDLLFKAGYGRTGLPSQSSHISGISRPTL